MVDITPTQLADVVAEAPFGALLNMPTGAGKTWIACEAIKRVVDKGCRAIFITPLRAMAEETAAGFRDLISDDVPIGIFTGDYGNRKKYPVPFHEARLLVMTPERLDACTRAWRTHWNWIPDVNLVVVDEVHLIGEYIRGPRLECAISRFRRLNPFSRITGLSATIGNPQELASWLNAGSFRSVERPIPLEWKVVRYKKAVDKPDLLVKEVHRAVAAGGSSLVFVQSRKRAEQLARYISEKGIKTNFHHAGLSHKERQEVENAFRLRETKTIVATSTLEMGLNLPVRQVVLYDLQAFDGSEFKPLSTNSVWQRVGRAGRRGLDDSGEAVLLAANWDRHASNYSKGRFERIESKLGQDSALTEQVIVEVSTRLARSRRQVHEVFRGSLFCQQSQKQDLDKAIDQMIESKMLFESVDNDRPGARKKIIATKLGRIAVRHMISPATVLMINRLCKRSTSLSIFDILLVLVSANECEPVLTVDFEELEILAAEVNVQQSVLLQAVNARELCEMLRIETRRFLSALKMACVLRAWTQSGSASKVAEKLDCYEFEVVRLVDATARLSLAARQIVKCQKEVVEGDVVTDGASETHLECHLKILDKMLSYGIDEQVASLALVPGIGGVMATRLLAVGVCSVKGLALSKQDDLLSVSGVSRTRAKLWIESAKKIVNESHMCWSLESKRSGGYVAVHPRKNLCDPYRLRRALDLRVERRVGNLFRVIGGLEPHCVIQRNSQLVCDCIDYQKGNLCKHILAVRLMKKDKELIGLVGSLGESRIGSNVDLFDCWFHTEHNLNRRIAV